jgi:hypothetical protein
MARGKDASRVSDRLKNNGERFGAGQWPLVAVMMTLCDAQPERLHANPNASNIYYP